jgi:hypothetical protein
MRELIDIQKEMQAHEESVNDIYQKLVQGEQIVSIIMSSFSLPCSIALTD